MESEAQIAKAIEQKEQRRKHYTVELQNMPQIYSNYNSLVLP
jgi:hypothetical protein